MNKKYTYVLLGVTSLVVVGTAGFLISEQIKEKHTSTILLSAPFCSWELINRKKCQRRQ